MNKLVYLGQSMSYMSKIVIYDYCYGNVKPKYEKKTKLRYMDMDSFIVQ